MKYYSRALGMQTTLNVIIPERKEGYGEADGEYKTLYLLHGLSDDYSMWLRRSSVERYADERGIAVVMPGVERSWYADTAYGENYFTFVAKELPAVCRSYFKGMSDRREDNFIAGLSMGGYGALKIALTFPEKFGGCASLSGALDIVKAGGLLSKEQLRGNFGFEVNGGDDLAGTENDLFCLAAKAVENNLTMPKTYLWCGTSDFLIEDNRRYHAHLDSLGIPHAYEESEGNHSWKYWDTRIRSALDYLL